MLISLFRATSWFDTIRNIVTRWVNFRENHLHKHELQLSDNIYRSILTQIYVFLVLFTIFHFDLEKFISKNCKNIFFYQKFVHLGKNTSIYCSRIIVVHVHATVFFLKFTQRVIILQTVSNQEVTLKKTDKHAADCSKAVCWGVK